MGNTGGKIFLKSRQIRKFTHAHISILLMFHFDDHDVIFGSKKRDLSSEIRRLSFRLPINKK